MAAPWMVSKGWHPPTPRPLPWLMASRPPEPRGVAGGGRASRQGLGSGLRLALQRGRKRGLSKRRDKHLHIETFLLTASASTGAGPLSRPSAPSFRMSLCPRSPRVRGPTELGIACWHPQLGAQHLREAEVLSLQAWPSGGPCGICKVTQASGPWICHRNPEEGIKKQ